MRKTTALQTGFLLIAAFAVWTALIRMIEVRPIGPNASMVGFAAISVSNRSLTRSPPDRFRQGVSLQHRSFGRLKSRLSSARSPGSSAEKASFPAQYS